MLCLYQGQEQCESTHKYILYSKKKEVKGVSEIACNPQGRDPKIISLDASCKLIQRTYSVVLITRIRDILCQQPKKIYLKNHV